MTEGIFITGTDTGVGKTTVSCALLRKYVAAGWRAVGMKPVAAGGGEDNDDLVALAGDSLTPTGRVHGTPNDRWLAVSWDPRRPQIEMEQTAVASDSGSVLYVQLSSSLNESWAQDYAQNLKRAGLSASVLQPSAPDEGYRVVLGPYPTREAAEDAGRKLGRSFWVFSRDPAPPSQ